MDLGLTPEQQTVQQEARRFLAAEITRERRLEWDRSPTGYDPAFWRAVSELGWLGYGLPAAHGGQGASLLDVGLLVEEWGRAAAPFGLFAALSGGLALAALGTPAQRRAWLPAVARGEKIVTLAVSEAEVEAEPAALRTALTRRGGRLRLDGAEAVLEMTVAHVSEREQFGAKLGTFQAVKQMVANMAIDLEGARHVTRQALWRLAARLPAEREVAIAKAWTTRAYRDI